MNRTTRHTVIAFASVLLLAPLAVCHAADDPKSATPNIVFILADDLGYGDVHCLNPQFGKIATPNLDRLVAEGMVFTDAHSGSAVCSPSRYGLLTGRYAWRTRLRTGVLNAFDPPLIAAGRLTVPALLKQHGYATACVGKWHLGWDWPKIGGKMDYSKAIANGPITRGFDSYFGTHVPNQPPYCFIENDRTVGIPSVMLTKELKAGRYHATGNSGLMVPGWNWEDILPALQDRAVRYIGERGADKRPFFLYLPLTSPHEPVAPSKQWQCKSGINPVADFIMQTDSVVGRVLDELQKQGLADNTLVFFSADNGHSPYTGLEGLLKHGHHPSGPFRGYKADIFDGGHHEPFIARWPGKIKPGTSCNDIICLTDLLATAADILGVQLPDNAGEDSVSILPDLLGAATAPVREAVVHQGLHGALAIRQERWKLEVCPGSNGYGNNKQWGVASNPADAEARKMGLPPVQLYDMAADIGETKNVQAEHPEIVKRLTQLLQHYIDAGRSTPGRPQKNDVAVPLRTANNPAVEDKHLP